MPAFMGSRSDNGVFKEVIDVLRRIGVQDVVSECRTPCMVELLAQVDVAHNCRRECGQNFQMPLAVRFRRGQQQDGVHRLSVRRLRGRAPGN